MKGVKGQFTSMAGYFSTNVLQQLIPEILNLEVQCLILSLTARSQFQTWNLNCYNK
jgi:hypothetical protein